LTEAAINSLLKIWACVLPVEDLDTMKEAARKILRMGPRFVLVKGGHLAGDAVGVLFDGESRL